MMMRTMSAPWPSDRATRRMESLQRYTPEAYIVAVRYVFDPAKDKINPAKHGVSLALAEVLFAGPHLSMTDDRFEYGEIRAVAFGLINGRLFAFVYADREAERRVISFRKANKREVKRYGENLE